MERGGRRRRRLHRTLGIVGTLVSRRHVYKRDGTVEGRRRNVTVASSANLLPAVCLFAYVLLARAWQVIEFAQGMIGERERPCSQ